jgi:hypothetical protein
MVAAGPVEATPRAAAGATEPTAPPNGAVAAGTASASAGTTHGGGGAAGFWSRLYYLPAPCDGTVLSLRRWLEEQAGGGPFRSTARQPLLLAGRAGVGAAAAAGSSLAPVGFPLVRTVPGEVSPR